MVHLRISRIFHCCFYRIFTYIVALYIHLYVSDYHILGFIDGIIPLFFRNDMCPFLGNKRTVHARCDICSYHCRFNRKCTASAERVEQYAFFIPRCEHDKCRCKRLRNRCFYGGKTITSLVKRLSRCVKPHHYFIFHYSYPHRITCSILLKPTYIIFGFKSVNHCLFHNGLYV